MSRLTRVALGFVPALSLLVVTACSSSGQPAGPAAGPAAAATQAAMTHIHAAVRDPKSGALLLATHEGLYRKDGAGLTLVGSPMDLMGFTIAADGTFYASGHPSASGQLPQPLGLVTSTDGGRSWTARSRGGESDFHALTAGPGLVAGFDGALWVSSDGAAWSRAGIAAQPHTLAVTPRGRLLAATARGLLSSTDRGGSWTTVTTPGLLLTVAVVDERTLVGATTDGVLVRSDDGGATWASGPRQPGQQGRQVQAVTASRTTQGVEIVVVTGTTVLSTTDMGATTRREL